MKRRTSCVSSSLESQNGIEMSVVQGRALLDQTRCLPAACFLDTMTTIATNCGTTGLVHGHATRTVDAATIADDTMIVPLRHRVVKAVAPRCATMIAAATMIRQRAMTIGTTNVESLYHQGMNGAMTSATTISIDADLPHLPGTTSTMMRGDRPHPGRTSCDKLVPPVPLRARTNQTDQLDAYWSALGLESGV